MALDFGDVKVYDVEPKKIPNLFHGQPVRIYGRYKGDGVSSFKFGANVAGHDLSQKGQLTFPNVDDANPEIERMWAWHRVDRLLKEADNDGSRTSVVDEIVRLGEGYSIVTEYTSFIVLENDGEYQRWKIDRKNALRTERDRASQQRTTEQLAKLRENATATIGPVEAQPAKQIAMDVPPAATPQPTVQTPVQQGPRVAPQQNQPTGQNFDFSLPRGGGAIDPVTGVLTILLTGGAMLAWKRPRKQKP